MPDVVQGPGRGAPAPIGIVYNTSMARPDAALALAALYAFGIRRQARVGAVCVTGAGLDTAIYCDLDGFKAVNDTYGHAAGDDVIREIGQRLRDSIRLTDAAVRRGGDEFRIL